MDSQRQTGRDVIECPACRRKTPAARAACFYCGAALAVERIAVAPAQPALESFEPAFNTVVRASASADEDRAAAALAAALVIEHDEARGIVSAGTWLPIARSQTRREAELIAGLACECGLQSVVVADQDLRLNEEPARARAAAFDGATLRVQLADRVMCVAAADLRLMVVGAIRARRVDFSETAGGLRGKGAGVVDSAEFVSEEVLLDLYAEDLARSCRIRADGFDYSGLVRPVAWRSALNFRAAIEAIGKAAPGARLDEAYERRRVLLHRAWPERTRTEARGVGRTGLAMRPVARASALRDNRDQFNRYSRLLWYAMNKLGFEG